MSWNDDDTFDKIFEKMLKQFGFNTRSLDPENVKTWSYGYKITMGPDGKPVVEEYGTNPFTQEPLRAPESEVEEPLYQVDVNHAKKQVTVIVEMPGVTKENIAVNAAGNRVNVKAAHESRVYNASIPIDAEVDPDTAKAKYNNGVLELTFNTVEPTVEGTRIEVE